MYLQVAGELNVAAEIGDETETSGNNNNGDNGQPVKPVCQIDSI